MVPGFADHAARQFLGRRPREDVHDAADRLRSVQRGERTADDLDPLDILRGKQREVVAREERRIHADSIDEHESVGRVRAPQKNRRLGSRPARAGHRRARDRPNDISPPAPPMVPR